MTWKMEDKFNYSSEEKQINKVLAFQEQELYAIKIDEDQLVNSISSTEELLISLGYSKNIKEIKTKQSKQNTTKTELIVPSWEELCSEANRIIIKDCSLNSLFSQQELLNNEDYILKLNEEYNNIHKLDSLDITICATAGILAGIIDILLIGIPGPTKDGLKAGPLANYIREYFEKVFPPEKMEKLGQKKEYKTPYDAQDNRNTKIHVEGLSTFYHRLLQLGHDPLLGFIIGVMDIMNGRMTTIDKSGKIVSQVMDYAKDRKETNIFKAFIKQLRHLKSDITTPMGLPVPFMALFNLLQIGKFGDEEQTIAEIVQGMYYEGYDFIHFCSMSIPVMFIEVIVRVGYCLKRMNEGYSLKDSIPYTLNRDKRPKLATMLFIAHSASAAINTGKVYFARNPMAINYPQWLAFGKYSYQQLKWSLFQKPEYRHLYVMNKLYEEQKIIYDSIDDFFQEFSKDYIVTFN